MLAAFAIVTAVGAVTVAGGLALAKRAGASSVPNASPPPPEVPTGGVVTSPEDRAATAPAPKADTNALEPKGDQTVTDIFKTGGSVIGAAVSLVGAAKTVIGLFGAGGGTAAAATTAAAGTGAAAGGSGASAAGATAGAVAGASAGSAAAAAVPVAIVAVVTAVALTIEFQSGRDRKWAQWTSLARGGVRGRYGRNLFTDENEMLETTLERLGVGFTRDYVRFLQHDGHEVSTYVPRNIAMDRADLKKLVAAIRYLSLEKLRAFNDVVVNFYWRGRDVLPDAQMGKGIALGNGDAAIMSPVDFFGLWRGEYLRDEWHATDLGYRLDVATFAELERIAREEVGVTDALVESFRYRGAAAGVLRACADDYGGGVVWPGDKAFAQSIAVQTGLTDARLSDVQRWRLAIVDSRGVHHDVNSGASGAWCLMCPFPSLRGHGIDLLETRRTNGVRYVVPQQKRSGLTRAQLGEPHALNSAILKGSTTA